LYSATQKKIIQESVVIIAELGIDSLTIKKIAERLNFTDAALYKHFKSKEEILEGIAHNIEQIFYSEFEEVLHSLEGSIEILKMLFLKHCEMVEKNNYNIIIFDSHLFFKKFQNIDDYINEILDTFKYSVVEIISIGQRKGEIRDDVDSELIYWLIISVLNNFLHQWNRNNSFSLKEQSLKIWEQITKMIEPCKTETN